MIIQFYNKDVYGRSRRYPADSKQRYHFQKLTGNQTISDIQYRSLEYFGVGFVEIPKVADPDDCSKK